MKRVAIFLFLASVVLAGCIINFGGSGADSTAGVFKSFDSGGSWIEKNMFVSAQGIGSIAGANVLNLILDPQDNKAIYLATDNGGLFYTYDKADSWQVVKEINTGRVEAVVVDPRNKCVIYSSRSNTIIKTVDCGRTWSEAFIDTRPDKAITALAIDSYNNLVIYAGNTNGDVLKSTDGGNNWRAIHRLDDRITKILVDGRDTRIIYVATSRKGIYKTTDSGNSWIDINDGLKQYSGAFEYKNLIFDENLSNSLLLVSKYGLIKTTNGGTNWAAINLITPPATTDIFSVAISPLSSQEIYYATASTFYKTIDGGENWITKRLPSGAIGTYLLIDPLEPNIIYLGMSNPSR